MCVSVRECVRVYIHVRVFDDHNDSSTDLYGLGVPVDSEVHGLGIYLKCVLRIHDGDHECCSEESGKKSSEQGDGHELGGRVRAS